MENGLSPVHVTLDFDGIGAFYPELTGIIDHGNVHRIGIRMSDFYLNTVIVLTISYHAKHLVVHACSIDQGCIEVIFKDNRALRSVWLPAQDQILRTATVTWFIITDCSCESTFLQRTILPQLLNRIKS